MTRFVKGDFTQVPSKSVRAGLSPKLQVIYMWLCDYSDESLESYPSRKTLASVCGISVRSLDDGLKTLEEMGMISKQVRVVNGEYTSSLYQVNIIAPPSANSAPGVAENNTTPSAESAHRTIPILNSTQLTHSKVEVQKDIRHVYDHFLKEFGKSESMYKLTDARKAKINSRLKDAGIEMVKKAITNTSKSDFHMGYNDRGWKADLDFIVRSYEQVEKLSNMVASRPKPKDDVFAGMTKKQKKEWNIT